MGADARFALGTFPDLEIVLNTSLAVMTSFEFVRKQRIPGLRDCVIYAIYDHETRRNFNGQARGGQVTNDVLMRKCIAYRQF